jgi:hypothetical protein
LRDKIAKLAKSSEMSNERNSLRGHNPQAVSVPQLLRGTSGIQPPTTVEQDCTNEGTPSGPQGASYFRPLKVTKTKRVLKRGSYTYAVIFKPSKLLAKGTLMSLAEVLCLSKGNVTFSMVSNFCSGTM